MIQPPFSEAIYAHSAQEYSALQLPQDPVHADELLGISNLAPHSPLRNVLLAHALCIFDKDLTPVQFIEKMADVRDQKCGGYLSTPLARNDAALAMIKPTHELYCNCEAGLTHDGYVNWIGSTADSMLYFHDTFTAFEGPWQEAHDAPLMTTPGRNP